MRCLHWLLSLATRRNRTPTCRVGFDDVEVSCVHPDGTTESIKWSDLKSVEIVTTSAGPFLEDVFYVLDGEGRSCVVPQGAEGCRAFWDRLGALPGFDHESAIRAMTCTDDARFPCWRAPGIDKLDFEACPGRIDR